ncbi:MAG: MerR family transcriptional regulator [Clostridia bacterium]|nr:MerR family transcriptional regulator [Clostridia bacterium]
MKMKEVCAKTGLTDRTVRYYIEEGLIAPAYTENYLGRRAFDFSHGDVTGLHDIAVLRAYGFSVEEIRDLIHHPENSPAIIRAVKVRTGASLAEQERRLAALASLPEDRIYTLAALAHAVSAPESTAIPEEAATKKPRPAAVFRLMLRVCAVWLPVLLGAVLLIIRALRTPYAVFHPLFLVLLGLSCLPSVLAMLPFKGERSARIKQLLVGACAVCIPLSALCAFVSVSECAHTWGELTTETAATCEHEGTLVRTCADCGARDTVTAKKLPHSLVSKKGYAPTCHSFGQTDGQFCEVCRTYTVKPHVIPMLSHEYGAPHYQAATCTASGGTTQACRDCGNVLLYPTEPPTGEHRFQEVLFADEELGEVSLHRKLYYRCVDCGFAACEYGKPSDTLTYYISGDPRVGYRRTLTVCGVGDMPDFSEGTPPPWFDSIYLKEVDRVILESGVTQIGAYAFSYPVGAKNPYTSVKSFIVRDPAVTLPSEHLGGILCSVTDEAFTGRYQSPEAVAAFLYFLENESSKGGALVFGNPDLVKLCFYDADGDGQEEMFLYTGAYEEDVLIFAYAYREGRVVELGSVGGAHTALKGIRGDTGVILHRAHEGTETVWHLRIAGESLVTEVLIPMHTTEGGLAQDPTWRLLTWFSLYEINFFGGK